MRRRKTSRGIFLCAFACIAIYSCTHVSGTFISTHGSMAGRSMSGNCMDCHLPGATEGAFTIAGTVFRGDGTTRDPNGTVYLFATPNGDVTKDSIIATIDVDGNGNFYTTHPYDLSGAFYPAVISGDTLHHMQTITNVGSCNSCHGVNQAPITVN